MLKHVRASWCNLSVISGNLSVLVLLWEAEGHPYEAITIPYKSANHLHNLHAAMLLGAKWPTTNQIMQQISTTERNLRLTWYAHCMLFKHSMDSMDMSDMTTESMAAMVRSFSIISRNHFTPVSWICWVLWSPPFTTRLQGIRLDYILSTACAVTNIHSLSLREQVIMIHDLFIMHLQKMRVDPIRRATLSHGRHCPSYPLTVLRSGVKHSKKWLLWHPDLRYHSLVFHVLESSKASCHSFRATAKRFAGVAKKLPKIPLHGWCLLQCKQLHFKTVWGSETWTLFGIWRPCQIQVVCASIQSSVWDENHPNTQSRERTQIHSGLHSLWKAIEYRTWTAENP